MNEGEYVDSLVSEYASLLHGRLSNDPQTKHAETGIVEDLARSADWSASGAHELMKLADRYGAFMLRNALAIAVVLGKEDGTGGF
jgi:hypothetical protein